MSEQRVGIGYDTHRTSAVRTLVLGGVQLPGVPGLHGFSDSDVLAHAVIDAVLGAAALGDIGRHFPDTDPRFAGADSGALLAEAARRVGEAGWRIANVDATIVAQAPKMAPHIPAMVQRIAGCLNVAWPVRRTRAAPVRSVDTNGWFRFTQSESGAPAVDPLQC